jgi:hypothetical protein
MKNFVDINIVYSPHKNEPVCVFNCPVGKIQISSKYDEKRVNVGMGWYSLRNPKPKDSLMVVEPYCVLPKDYEFEFCSKFKHIFSWASKVFTKFRLQNKLVEINLASCKGTGTGILDINKNMSWENRANEIIFVANNKKSDHFSELYTLRTQLADILHEKSKFKVKWYGQIPLNKPYYIGEIKNKMEVLRRAKFSVCCENSYDSDFTHNYFTEKLPEVWFSGATPLYMGCYNINDFNFPAQSYMDLRKYVTKNKKKIQINEDLLLKDLDSFTPENYSEYLHLVKNEVLNNNKVFNIISYHRVYNKMVQTFLKD